MTAVAQVAFPNQANGSFITVDGRTIGSSLIGQAFERAEVLLGPAVGRRRDRRTRGYDGNASAGSNLGPTSQKLIERDDRRGRRASGRPTATRPSRSTS